MNTLRPLKSPTIPPLTTSFNETFIDVSFSNASFKSSQTFIASALFFDRRTFPSPSSPLNTITNISSSTFIEFISKFLSFEISFLGTTPSAKWPMLTIISSFFTLITFPLTISPLWKCFNSKLSINSDIVRFSLIFTSPLFKAYFIKYFT